MKGKLESTTHVIYPGYTQLPLHPVTENTHTHKNPVFVHCIYSNEEGWKSSEHVRVV